MNPQIAETLSRFTSVGLDELNGKAAMLERLDKKYIIPAARLAPAFSAFSDLFDVLEIDGKRAFTYATRYFDDDRQQAYYDHHQGRRKRCKVRVRHYVDADFSYLEVKLKDIRDVTVKKRLQVANNLTGLDARCLDFIESCYQAQYGIPFARFLSPVVCMEYQRITLVAKEGGERMTIDTGMRFWSDETRCDVPSDLFIVEAKSARGNGIADRILRGRHLHPTPRCSKYCIAMATLGNVSRHNRFLPALKKLSLTRGNMPEAAAWTRAVPSRPDAGFRPV